MSAVIPQLILAFVLPDLAYTILPDQTFRYLTVPVNSDNVILPGIKVE